MNIERIKEIQQNTAYPESKSVYQALLQVWNECAQEQLQLSSTNINWIDFNTKKPNYGDLIILKSPPEAMTLPTTMIYDKYTPWMDGDVYVVIETSLNSGKNHDEESIDVGDEDKMK